MRKDRFLNLVSDAAKLAQQLNDALHGLEKLQNEWNAQDYTNNAPDLNDTSETGYGKNHEFTDVTKSQVASVVYDTANAVRSLWSAGHATNITNLLK